MLLNEREKAAGARYWIPERGVTVQRLASSSDMMAVREEEEGEGEAKRIIS